MELTVCRMIFLSFQDIILDGIYIQNIFHMAFIYI